MVVQGLTPREGVALAARPRSALQQQRLGWSGSWTPNPNKLSNEYFKVLLNNDWVKIQRPAGGDEYKAKGKSNVFMTPGNVHMLQWLG